MTETITPPPLHPQQTVEALLQRCENEAIRDTLREVAERAVRWCRHTDHDHDEIMDLLNALCIDRVDWPSMDVERTFDVTFTAMATFDREITVVVDAFDTDEDTLNHAIMEALCDNAEGDNADGVIQSVEGIEDYFEQD